MQIKRRIIVTLAVLGLAAAGLGVFVAIPSSIRIKELRASIIEERGNIERRYALRNYVRTSLAEIERTRRNLDDIRSVAVREGEELEFIRALEDAATSTGVGMTINLETANQAELSSWERWVPIRIEVSGQFPQVSSFLNEMEHLPYYVILDSLLVTTPRRGGVLTRDGSVEALFSGKVYWQASTVPDVLKVDSITAEMSAE